MIWVEYQKKAMRDEQSKILCFAENIQGLSPVNPPLEPPMIYT